MIPISSKTLGSAGDHVGDRLFCASLTMYIKFAESSEGHFQNCGNITI